MNILATLCMLLMAAGEETSAVVAPVSSVEQCLLESNASTSTSQTSVSGSARGHSLPETAMISASDQLLDALESRDAARVTTLVDQVRAEDRGKRVIPQLALALRDRDAVVRWQAARMLGMFGHDAATVSGSLEAAVNDKDPLVCWAAAESLQRVSPNKDLSAKALVRLLRNKDERVRWDAAVALGLMGPDAKIAVPALTESLRDPAEWVRRESAHALGEIGPAAESALPALVVALGDNDEFVRAAASDSIETLIPDSTRMQMLISAYSLVTVQTAEQFAEQKALKELQLPSPMGDSATETQ